MPSSRQPLSETATKPAARPSRADGLIARLTEQIVGGRLAPGTRLPTEQTLAQECGVSRTVVREAVAALRADGLVVTRQGAGAFVAELSQQRPFRIGVDALDSLERVIDVMELRIGVEAEAAALAATRRTAADLRRMQRALATIDAATRSGARAMPADFEFHLAIVDATGNPVFHDFLTYLGQFIIPRQSVRQAVSSPAAQSANARLVQQEHRGISTAIRARDATAASAAMRLHLSNSRERYRHLRASLAS